MKEDDNPNALFIGTKKSFKKLGSNHYWEIQMDDPELDHYRGAHKFIQDNSDKKLYGLFYDLSDMVFD